MINKAVWLILCFAWGGVASAAVYFNNSQGDNSYVNDLNWNGARGTTGGEAVNLGGADQPMLLTGDTETSRRLWIANSTGISGEITIDGGSLALSDYFHVGYKGSGKLNMASGTVNVTGSSADITLGHDAGASGTLDMTSGQMTANRFFLVGRSGTGEMTMSGGTTSTMLYDFSLGNQATGVGAFTMTDGLLNAARDFIVGERGDGVMTMSGGAITVAANFRIAEVVGSSGELNFSGGTINAADFLIGDGVKTAGMVAFSGTAQMILNGDDVTVVQGYIDDGLIIGATNAVYDPDLNKTVIKAVQGLGEPIQIDGMTMVGDSVLLNWSASESVSYDVMASSNLVSGEWSVVDTVPAASGSVIWTSAPITDLVLFYKVQTGAMDNTSNFFEHEYTGPDVDITTSGVTSNGFTVTYDAVSSGDSRVLMIMMLSSPMQLAVGESALLNFTWNSTQVGGMNQGFRWGFDFGNNVVQACSDTRGPASVFHLHRYDTTGDPLTASGTDESWANPPTALPATDSYFMPGNLVSVTTTLKRVSSETYTMDVTWGGQTYSSTALLNSDHVIDSIFFMHGQASGGGVAQGDNFTISNVTLAWRQALYELSDDFISYIKNATNPDLIGLRNNELGEGRFYPYSPPIGRRIAYDQPIPDNTLYVNGWSLSDAEDALRSDLEETVEKLRPIVLLQTGQSFDSLALDSQEILVDFGYSEGVESLSADFINDAVNLNWSALMDPWVYVRYEADWPDIVRNKAYLTRWGAKGGL